MLLVPLLPLRPKFGGDFSALHDIAVCWMRTKAILSTAQGGCYHPPKKSWEWKHPKRANWGEFLKGIRAALHWSDKFLCPYYNPFWEEL